MQSVVPNASAFFIGIFGFRCGRKNVTLVKASCERSEMTVSRTESSEMVDHSVLADCDRKMNARCLGTMQMQCSACYDFWPMEPLVLDAF
jgi:hypothetical protein